MKVTPDGFIRSFLVIRSLLVATERVSTVRRPVAADGGVAARAVVAAVDAVDIRRIEGNRVYILHCCAIAEQNEI
jgi:hypothetical protein